MESIGYLTALGAALAWGSYNVPFKKSAAANVIQFQALMSVGALVFAFIFSVLLGYSFSLNLYGLLAGFLWAFANLISLVAIHNIGLSRAVPIWMSAVITVSFLWGVIIFNELPSGILTGILGIILIIVGVVVVTGGGRAESKNKKLGILAALLAGSLFGTYFAPIKFANLSPQETLFPMSLGVAIFGLGFPIIRRIRFKNEAIFNSILSGMIWNLGNLLSFFAVSIIGLAKAFPMTQSAVLVAVLWGLFYFKEVSSPKQKLQILMGALILLIGIVTLGLA